LYLRVEFQVRKIALLLAKNTDSAFSGKPTSRESSAQGSGINENFLDKVPAPTIIPNPPKWSAGLLR